MRKELRLNDDVVAWGCAGCFRKLVAADQHNNNATRQCLLFLLSISCCGLAL